MKIKLRHILWITLNLILVSSCDKKTPINESININPLKLIGESKDEVICYLGVPMNLSTVDIKGSGNLAEYQSNLYKNIHRNEKSVLEMIWDNDEYGTIVIWFNTNNIAIDGLYWSDDYSY